MNVALWIVLLGMCSAPPPPPPPLSNNYHQGQKPTMVGICHGGNMPVGHDDEVDDDNDDKEDVDEDDDDDGDDDNGWP